MYVIITIELHKCKKNSLDQTSKIEQRNFDWTQTHLIFWVNNTTPVNTSTSKTANTSVWFLISGKISIQDNFEVTKIVYFAKV